MLNHLCRIRIKDGRVFEGQLKCYDKDLNVVLVNTTEKRFFERNIGTVMVNGRDIERVEVKR